jgi:hypothetical protein|tara:strand:- start:893 stop:1114 length:222 start_codon:yes stop_codon:yes gene_type:complete
MILLLGYESIDQLKACLGKPLNYKETSVFNSSYKHNGTFVASYRPDVTKGEGRQFFVRITMKDGLITLVGEEL